MTVGWRWVAVVVVGAKFLEQFLALLSALLDDLLLVFFVVDVNVPDFAVTAGFFLLFQALAERVLVLVVLGFATSSAISSVSATSIISVVPATVPAAASTTEAISGAVPSASIH
uniref:(northern house mosquito) hypothetical protein n=1 Tax=Culex pipiens TaxID=7175 RepID=A0A8D8HGP1_CULPI